jgi:hypothetical protein
MALRCYCAETERTPRSGQALQPPSRAPIEAGATTPETSLPRLRGRSPDRAGALFRPGLRADGLPHTVLGDHTRPPTHEGTPATLPALRTPHGIAWHLLANDCDYADLGGDYFVRRDRDRARQRAVAQLQALGYQVTLEPLAA